MIRWHQKDCRDPVVVLIGSIPSCKSCGGVFSLDESVALQATGAGSCLNLPADEPYGQMNLWWPPSVRYTKGACGGTSQGCVQEEPEILRDSPSNAPSAIRAEVYGETLLKGSFRLACLSACQEPSDPVHIDLETYRHSHSPDYEAASYVWGGEAGDSTPRRPIFIGEYWDVFLQTENCYELLRYARPRRGLRWLWVDAVCINQENLLERAAQVAMMHQIYSECLRCLVYLGPDMVQWHGNHLPGRQGFHELIKECDQIGKQTPCINIQRLLKERKYFSRVWVIQELIRSPRMIIPIGDTIYWADNTTGRRMREDLSGTWDWDATAAPWLQNMSQERFSTERACESLLLTRNTHCSDPRDRLFGLLGLLRSNSGADAPLQPNYALSSQHIWMGFFAHSILKDAAVWLLYNSAGHRAPASAPSWAPLWNQAATWSNLFCPDVNSDKIPLELLNLREDPTEGYTSYIASESFGMEGIKDFKSPDWRQDITVDAHTGTLLGVRAMLLFTFLEKPEVRERIEDLTIFHSGDNGSVEIACREPLDQIIQPYIDQLFMLRIQSSIVFLVLRDLGTRPYGKLSNEKPGQYVVFSQPSRYRLVAACPALFFGNRSPHLSSLAHDGITPMCVSFLERSGTLQDKINELRHALNNKELRSFVIFAPFIADQWGLLPLFWKLPRHLNRFTRDEVLDAYLACMPRDCIAKIQEPHVMLEFDNHSNLVTARLNEWFESASTAWYNGIAIQRSAPFKIDRFDPSSYIDWEWSLDGEMWQSFANWSYMLNFHGIPPLETGRHTNRIYLRAHTAPILHCIMGKEHRGLQFAEAARLFDACLSVTDAFHSVTHFDELRSIISDTTKDWSSFKYQQSLKDCSPWEYFFKICGQMWTIDIV